MSGVIKKVVLLLAVAFAIFYVITKPAQAADLVQSTAALIADGFTNVIRFFSALFS